MESSLLPPNSNGFAENTPSSFRTSAKVQESLLRSVSSSLKIESGTALLIVRKMSLEKFWK